MKTYSILNLRHLGWFWLVNVALLLSFAQIARGGEQSFDELQIGTQTYKNVTVTTKSKNYIFILHSAGMTNIRVVDLPEEVRARLGYVDTTEKPKTNTPAVWAKATLSKLQTPQLKGVEQKLASTWNEQLSLALSKLPPITPTFIATVSGIALALFFFFSYCCMLICQKAGYNPGLLIFVPLFQALPLFRAAQMSRWWFLPLMIPGINLIPHLVWLVKIVRARHKSGWLAVWLVFPVTSFLAFLYLAFSSGRPPEPKRPQRRVEIMTLETA